MPKTIQCILMEYKELIESLNHEHVKAVILYGSYARGDYRPDSDIDIMILVGLDEAALKSFELKVIDITYDFNWQYDVQIVPVVQNIQHFNYWKKVYLFYRNVEEEGVLI